MIIPYQKLEKETLVAIVKDWLSRQSQESSVDLGSETENVEKVISQLERKVFFVTWNSELETMNIVEAHTALNHKADDLSSDFPNGDIPVDYQSNGDQSSGDQSNDNQSNDNEFGDQSAIEDFPADYIPTDD